MSGARGLVPQSERGGAVSGTGAGSSPAMSSKSFRTLERVGEDHLDVIALDLRIDRPGALVLPVDELGLSIRHDVALEGAGGGGQRLGDLAPVGGAGALDGVGKELHAGIVERHVVGPQLPRALDLLLHFGGLGIARV